MIKFVALFVFAFVVQVAYSDLPFSEYGEPLASDSILWHDNCVILTDTTQDQIEEVKKGVFKEDDTKMKKYLSCLWLESRCLNKDFEMNVDILRSYVPKQLPKEEVAGFLKCAEDAGKAGKDFVDKVWLLTKCNYNRDPEKFIMF